MNYNSILNILTLRYDPQKISPKRPLQYNDFLPKNISDIEQKLLTIIEKDLISKKKNLKIKHISVSLSAGIDSGLTLALLKKFLPNTKISCFGMGFGDKDDEITRAKEIARIYNCDFYGIVKDDVLRDLPKLISLVKESRWNLYQYYVLAEAKKRSNFFFSGDAGDELFGGYVFRYKKFISNLSHNSNWKDKIKLYLSCHERDWVPDQEKIFGSKIKFSWEKIYKNFKPFFDNSLSPLDQVFLADFNGKLLHDWIPTNHAFGKFLDLRIDSIFLNDGMIKFATHIPWQEKYDIMNNNGKIPLRNLLRKQQGFEKFHPIKKGFSIDMNSLWDKNAKEIVNRYINSDSEVVKNNIINDKWITTANRKIRESSVELKLRYINKLLLILSLEIWYRLFVSKTIDKNQTL